MTAAQQCVAEERHRDGRGLWAGRCCTLETRHTGRHEFAPWAYNVPPTVLTQRDVDRLVDIASEQRARAERAEQTIATLRAWMAEYPNDKYTGSWWLAELDRITSQAVTS